MSNDDPGLFPGEPMTTPSKTKAKPAPSDAAPRINKPERFQGEMYAESLDQRLEPDHLARVVWRLVEGLDLSPLYQKIEAVEGGAGRDASDPRVLFALLLYAAIDGIDSAREIARLCFQHRAYEWLRGKVAVNHHMLSDFRVQQGELLKQLQEQSLAGMLKEGLVSLECAAQDGMRLRASAGSDSFRKLPKLQEAQKQAHHYLEQLERESADDPAAPASRQQKARERAARERDERVQRAIDAVTQMAEPREKRKKGDGVNARASTTDPEARKMKMADGGFRPAYNVQMATDTQSGIILSMDVINESDAGQMKPMMDDIKEAVGEAPKKLLTDGGFATIADIEETERGGTTVYTPVKEEAKQKSEGKDPFTPTARDSEIIGTWRIRMGTLAAQLLYKLRASTAEWSNARLRNQGVYQVNVRGLEKVKAVLWWHVLAINLLRAERLRAAKLASAKEMSLPIG